VFLKENKTIEVKVRSVDYNSRRKQVLNSAISRYIKNALPVASDDIAEEFDLSSATIRNIFTELDQSGYLKHPYTSGGRVPTDKGYRYYVDFLIRQMELLDGEKQCILKECKKKMHRLDDCLENTSEVISEITHYAGIVSFLQWQDKLFYKGISRILDQPEFKEADKIRLLVRMMEDKGKLLDIINRDFTGKVKVYIGSELGFPGMDNCSLVVSGFKVKNQSTGRLAVLGPIRMEYDHIIPTMEYISEVLNQILEEF
jgi:transcriptional regulator of heat shock response